MNKRQVTKNRTTTERISYSDVPIMTNYQKTGVKPIPNTHMYSSMIIELCSIVQTINGPLVTIMERTRRWQQYCNEWHLCFRLAVSFFATQIYTACTFNKIV